MHHDLKCHPPEFLAVCRGEKSFEVRSEHDRLFSVGDTITLQEWDPDAERYSGASLDVQVNYKLEGGRFGLPEGICVLQIDREFVRGHERCRRELAALGNAAVDGLMINHVFNPHNPSEPLPKEQTPLNRDELAEIRAAHRADIGYVDVLRLLATIDQRDRIYYAIGTDADPAGTYRELVQLRDLVAQLHAKLAECQCGREA